MGQQGIAAAQRAQQARQLIHPYSHLNGSFPPQQAGSSYRAQQLPPHLPPSFPHGSMFPSQSVSHAQHLGSEPSALPSADDEAQLFFNQQPNQTPSPAPKVRSLQQQHEMWQQQQYHWQPQQLQQGWQQQRPSAFPPSGFPPSGFPPSGFPPSEDAQQGPWIPHLQAHLSLPLQGPASTCYTHYHSSLNTPQLQLPQQQQQHVPLSSSMHGWQHHMHSNSGVQHAQHGVNGFVNAQHNMVQSGSQQAQQAGSNHSVQSMQGSMQSAQSGQSQRAAGGSSTAFILWVDGQLKQRGQTEKRAALRQFIQASRVSLCSMISQPMHTLDHTIWSYHLVISLAYVTCP